MKIELDLVTAQLLLSIIGASWSESYRDWREEFDVEEVDAKEIEILEKIRECFPDLAKQYKYLYDKI